MCALIQHAHHEGMPHDTLIVEVGSAHGYGIWTARHFGHPILGFECRKDEHSRLHQQFHKDPMVSVMHACVGDVPGTSRILHAGDSSSMSANASRVDGNSTEEVVQVVTLDHLLTGIDPPPWLVQRRVGVIAIDVQGFEGHVLRGATALIQRDKPFIMYEDTELQKGEMMGRLLMNVLMEIGDGAHEWYRPCYCERDCYCFPRDNVTRSGGWIGVSRLSTTAVDTPPIRESVESSRKRESSLRVETY